MVVNVVDGLNVVVRVCFCCRLDFFLWFCRLTLIIGCGQVAGYQGNHAMVGGSRTAAAAAATAAGYGSPNSRLTAGNSSVLRSIDEILREDRQVLTRSRSSSAGVHRYDLNVSPTRLGTSPTRQRYNIYGSHSRGASPSRAYGVPGSEEERSMERLASTFRSDDYTSSLYERLHDFSPLASDPEVGSDYTTPAAMPLLPDMPSRSRKLLEDLAGDSHLPRGKYGASSSRYLSPR